MSSLLLVKPIDLSCDQITTIKAALAGMEWGILLESCAKDHVDSRYDILAAEPIAQLVCEQSISHLTIEGEYTCSDEDPLTLLSDTRKALFPHKIPHELPFVGGALGYFGYDLGRRFEALPQTAKQDIQMPDMAVGFYDWALLIDNKKDCCFVVQYGADAREKLKNRVNWLTQLRSKNSRSFALTADWASNMNQQMYADKFRKVQDYLLSGDCYQVNLAQRFNAGYRGDEYLAYQALINENKPPFASFMRIPQGVALSISPERFLKLEHSRVETKPIKGTRPRSIDPEQDRALRESLQTADKDRAENLMIVDLLRNDIGRVCLPGTVKVPKLFDIESFPAVHHLVSTITGELKPEHEPEDLLRACFPGGSITGAPKIRAMEVIEELEPHRRSLYCGSMGYISSDGKMDTNITIRTLICTKQRIYCWAGGGLVADSDVEAEYQETFDKLAKILPVLTRAQIG